MIEAFQFYLILFRVLTAEAEEPSTPKTTSDPADRGETNSNLLSPPSFPSVFSGEFNFKPIIYCKYYGPGTACFTTFSE